MHHVGRKLLGTFQNRLLARQNTLRLSAEALRDSVLAVSGLLDRKIGGPSIYPPQPESATREAYGENRWPVSKGRDHHPFGFTMLAAGGGIQSGQIVGKTDDLGYHAIEDRIDVNDLQATILQCLGFDHTRLTYRYKGRDFRLTDVGGRVIDKLIV